MPDLPVVGKVPKGWLIAVGGISVVVIGYAYIKHRKSAAAAATSSTAPATAGTSGDPYPPDGTSGNPSDPNSTDPATGMTYGDEALYGGGSGGYGTGGLAGGWGGGSGGGVPSGSGLPGPGSFTSNAQWAQYAQQQLAGVVDPTALSAALGVYLTDQAASTDQVSLIDQAIAVAGYPPVSGPGGYPPAIKQGGGPPPPGGGRVGHRQVASGTESLDTYARRRNTTAAQIIAFNNSANTGITGQNLAAFNLYVSRGPNQLMPRGLVFYTANP